MAHAARHPRPVLRRARPARRRRNRLGGRARGRPHRRRRAHGHRAACGGRRRSPGLATIAALGQEGGSSSCRPRAPDLLTRCFYVTDSMSAESDISIANRSRAGASRPSPECRAARTVQEDGLRPGRRGAPLGGAGTHVDPSAQTSACAARGEAASARPAAWQGRAAAATATAPTRSVTTAKTGVSLGWMTTVDAWLRDERLGLVTRLSDLSPSGWETPSLCQGWSVRHVVAHLVTPFAMRPSQMAVRVAKARSFQGLWTPSLAN